MKRAIVLGGGMVGSVMARDLAQDLDVTVADVRPQALARLEQAGLRAVRADLADPARVGQLVAEYDLVLGALSSAIGFQTLRAVLEAGKSYVDISFMPEDGTELDALARARGVTAVIDCGVAPGISNMAAGFAVKALDRCERIDICVGGLPVVRRLPYDYKAGFSPYDVIEMYTRPARQVEGGRVVIKEALSEPELIDFPGIGTLEAFNTDGLRSLCKTLSVPTMRERTLRYPGHIDLMRAMRGAGLFSKQPIEIAGGQKVRPLDVTAALLFPVWTYQPGEADLTVMRIEAIGAQGGARIRYRWDLLDYHDPASDTRSMSRTTALPAALMARAIASGRFVRKGVHPPEVPGAEAGFFDWMLSELERRGVRYERRVERWI
jgi:saccharopine dehydrogenase-like NADP-dependent oxidoreductase